MKNKPTLKFYLLSVQFKNYKQEKEFDIHMQKLLPEADYINLVKTSGIERWDYEAKENK